jgi:hypothetical protein
MEEYETVTLILSTLDISTSQGAQTFNSGGAIRTTDNQYGTISDNKCNITWKGVNLRMLMGNDIFNKYETFNLYLYQISQGQGLSPTVTMNSNSFYLVDIKMRGLPWLNNSYSVATRTNTNEAFLTSYLLNNSSSTQIGTVTPMFNPSILTFGKSADCVDINITMTKTLNRDYPLATNNTAFGTFVFMFKIYGIPTRENIISNGRRIFQ